MSYEIENAKGRLLEITSELNLPWLNDAIEDLIRAIVRDEIHGGSVIPGAYSTGSQADPATLRDGWICMCHACVSGREAKKAAV